MPTDFTVTFSDEITAWLREKAVSMNMDVGALVAMIVDDVAEQATTTLAWQEHDLLEICRHLALRPERVVPLQTLWAGWRDGEHDRSHDDFVEGLNGLAACGFLEISQEAPTFVCLTELGWDAMRARDPR